MHQKIPGCNLDQLQQDNTCGYTVYVNNEINLLKLCEYVQPTERVKKWPPILNQLSHFNVQLEVKFTVHSEA